MEHTEQHLIVYALPFLEASRPFRSEDFNSADPARSRLNELASCGCSSRLRESELRCERSPMSEQAAEAPVESISRSRTYA